MGNLYKKYNFIENPADQFLNIIKFIKLQALNILEFNVCHSQLLYFTCTNTNLIVKYTIKN